MVDFAYGPLISSDGKTVVFMSDASNLVPADTNGNQDIFVNTR
jgi:TolB protein